MAESVLLNGRLFVEVIRAKGLYNSDSWFAGKSDPYTIVTLDDQEIGRTEVIDDNLDPVWNSIFVVDAEHPATFLTFDVWDEDPCQKDDHLGYTVLNVSEIVKEKKIFKTANLVPDPAKGSSAATVLGTIEIRVRYQEITKLIERSWQIKDGNFPARKYNHVYLFNDAHNGEDAAPYIQHDHSFTNITSQSEDKHAPKKSNQESKTELKEKSLARQAELDNAPKDCWVEIFKALQGAKHFIYITGWSVWTALTLLRRPVGDPSTEKTLGNILKEKARQGVRVLILIWNDKTSWSLGGGDKPSVGLMATHDEETTEFFTNTGVYVISAYREAAGFGDTFIWTHHQKSVILDAELPGHKKRQVVAFVGGLDLTDGRWDTPKHSLYRTLSREHANDFHIPWANVPHDLGPREPWHDIHSKVEGPIAWDVKTNFEQRWKKQASSRIGDLYQLDSHFFITPPVKPEDKPTDYPIHGDWTVQLLRSIDLTSAVDIQPNPPGVDKSIQLAYLNAIRNAKRFLYLENQYFMGSSFAWEDHREAPAPQKIPFEIAARIASRIRKGRDFAVYILLPLFPEGDPQDSSLQEMLLWQWYTISFMYKTVAQAIKEMNLKDRHPTDYLNFYCLGNRETTTGSEAKLHEVPASFDGDRTVPETLAKSRRFMIYVHSKMLIADDEYIIVGSANINERSMAGDRDTEIAIGAYEDNWLHVPNPRGAVHRFRMNLWGEHLNECLKEFLNPENPNTVKLINKKADENWIKYVSDPVVDMSGHLMRYPIVVHETGTISPKVEFFPDTKASVRGQKSLTIPDKVTT